MEKAITSGNLNIPAGFMKLLTSMSPITAMLTIPRAGMGLASVGIAQAAFEASVKYARERVQFGKPIGRFQLIQEMLYEMAFYRDSQALSKAPA